MASAVVVVESHVTGGALITAATALEQGVPVFAVPGDVDRPSSAGCNLLIRDGAHPVLDPEDLIAELELVVGPASAPGEVAGKPARSTEARSAVPAGGATIDELCVRLGLDSPEVLGKVVIWEAAGLVEMSGDRVHPRRM